jgi:hypothetical protein
MSCRYFLTARRSIVDFPKLGPASRLTRAIRPADLDNPRRGEEPNDLIHRTVALSRARCNGQSRFRSHKLLTIQIIKQITTRVPISPYPNILVASSEPKVNLSDSLPTAATLLHLSRDVCSLRYTIVRMRWSVRCLTFNCPACGTLKAGRSRTKPSIAKKLAERGGFEPPVEV